MFVTSQTSAMKTYRVRRTYVTNSYLMMKIFHLVQTGNLALVKRHLTGIMPRNILLPYYLKRQASKNDIIEAALSIRRHGITLLIAACLYGRADIVRYFLKLGADAKQCAGRIKRFPQFSGHAPIEVALRRQHNEIVVILARHLVAIDPTCLRPCSKCSRRLRSCLTGSTGLWS